MATVTHQIGGCILAAGLAFAGSASAREAADPLGNPAKAEVMSLDELASLSGGDGVDVNVITQQTLSAINTGNSVTAGETVGSGNLNIGSHAFTGFSGIGNFVMNTGHNNNLQASMSVSVVLAPPAVP